MANYNSQAVVISRYFSDLILTAMKADPGEPIITNPKVRLSKDPLFNPTPTATRAELAANEADFSGYTAGGYTPTFSANANLSTVIMGIVANVLPIMATADPLVTNNVFGYWIDDGVGVLVAEKFAGIVSVQFSQVGDFLDLMIKIPVSFYQSTV